MTSGNFKHSNPDFHVLPPLCIIILQKNHNQIKALHTLKLFPLFGLGQVLPQDP